MASTKFPPRLSDPSARFSKIANNLIGIEERLSNDPYLSGNKAGYMITEDLEVSVSIQSIIQTDTFNVGSSIRQENLNCSTCKDYFPWAMSLMNWGSWRAEYLICRISSGYSSSYCVLNLITHNMHHRFHPKDLEGSFLRSVIFNVSLHMI